MVYSVFFFVFLQPSYSLHAHTGPTPVMSLDFHPKKTDLFCFSDNDNEIRYFNINPFACTRVSKVCSHILPITSSVRKLQDIIVLFQSSAQGGTAQVRFQPRIGHLLAAASDKVVSIFDVETDRQTFTFQVLHFKLTVCCL